MKILPLTLGPSVLSSKLISHLRTVNSYITSHWLLLADNKRVIASFAGILFTLSILFSPIIRRFLSHRYFVFLGSISFSLYLLHGTFIRLPLQWILVLVLPKIAPDILVTSGDENLVYMDCPSFGCRFIASIAYLIWFALLLAFSKVWKDNVDILGIHVSRWAEDVVLGKRRVIIRMQRLNQRRHWLPRTNSDTGSPEKVL